MRTRRTPINLCPRLILGAVLLAAGERGFAAGCSLPPGLISTVAGTGLSIFNGDGIQATSANLNSPAAVALDASGNFYIADTYNSRIRKVDAGTGMISTVAGNGLGGYTGDGGAATAAQLYFPTGVAVDAAGNVYIADQSNGVIRKVNAGTGVISTVAGTGTFGYSGDGAAATAADLAYPAGVAVDAAGNLYIADEYNSVIRKVDAATGLISTIAGSGGFGYNGDGISATTADLDYPAGVAVDAAGNVYIADQSNSRIRMVDAGTGLISTVAGTGNFAYTGDDGAATAADLDYPAGVAVDAAGDLLIADQYNSMVRRVDAGSGLISRVAGTGNFAFNGDGGLATAADMNSPTGVAADSACRVYIVDQSNARIRRVDPAVLTGAVAVGPTPGVTGQWMQIVFTVTNSGAASITGTAPALQLNAGGSLVVLESGPLPAGPLTLAPGTAASFTWTYSCSGAGTLAFTATVAGTDSGSGLPALAVLSMTAPVLAQLAVALQVTPNLAQAGQWVTVVLTLTNNGASNLTGVLPALATNGGAVTWESGPSPTGPLTLLPGAMQAFTWSYSVAGAGVVSLTGTGTGTDTGTGVLLTSAQTVLLGVGGGLTACTGPPGLIGTVAGTGIPGDSADGIAATSAALDFATGVAVDAAGNFYFCERFGHRIRKVNAGTGVISTVAGTGTGGYNSDGIAATAAELNYPSGIAVDSAGNVIIADASNYRVRKVSAVSGAISTIAGTGTFGYNGDGIAATAAKLSSPMGVAVDLAGNVYVADQSGDRIRKIDASSGLISTIAGTGVGGYNGDGIAGTAAWLSGPGGVAVDGSGNVYVADQGNGLVREIIVGTGIIRTIAGTGSAGYNGDGIPGSTASLYNPTGVAVDGAGNVYIADEYNSRIRRVDAASGLISSVAGTFAGGYNGDGRPATTAQLYYPCGVALDSQCRIYVADAYNYRIRRIAPAVLAASVSVIPAAGVTGEWMQIVLTVTNMGSAPVTGVVPAISLNSGAALVSYVAGPSPTGPVTLNPGVTASFTWTYSCSGAGTVNLTLTAVGTDSGTGLPTLDVAGASVAILAELAATLRVIPRQAAVGQWVTVVLTVTNNGTNSVTTVMPALAASGAVMAWETGPIPTGPVTIAAGGLQTFTWTYSVSGSGVARFTGTATGTDSGTGTALLSVARTMLGVQPPYPTCSTGTAVVSTVAGTGTYGFSGDGGPATSAQFGAGAIEDLAVDYWGNIYIPDEGNARVRKVDAMTGIVTTIAGTGVSGVSGDGGPATAAQTRGGTVAADGIGDAFLGADGAEVRKVDGVTGLITMIAGTGVAGFSGDGGPATSAQVSYVSKLAADFVGDVFFGDAARVRRVDAATGVITTIAGTGISGFTGDGGAATSAQITGAYGICVAPNGDIYFGDSARIRRIDVATGLISTVVGNGTPGYNGEGIPATSAELISIQAVSVDGSGNIYIAEAGARVRRVDAGTGLIATFAGTGVSGFNGDGLIPTATQLSSVDSVSMDGFCRIYIDDEYNSRVRRVDLVPSPFLSVTITASPAAIPAGGTIRYTITVVNSGLATAVGVTLVDTLPGCAAYLGSSGGGALLGAIVAWPLPNLLPGSSTVVTLDVQDICATGIVGPDRASAKYHDSAGLLTLLGLSNWVTVPILSPVVQVVKSVAPAVVPGGGTFTYSLLVSNTGTDTATAISVWDTLPAGAGFSAASAGGAFDGVKVDWTVANLVPGASATVWVQAIYLSTGATVGPNTGWAGWSNSVGWTRTSARSNPVTVAGETPHVVVVKSAFPTAVAIGGTVTYTLSLTNTGTDTATSLAVWDTLPPGTTFAAASGAWSWDGTRVLWALPALAPGAGTSVTVSAVVDGTADPVGPNTAFDGFADSAGEPFPGLPSNPVTVGVKRPVLGLVKSAVPAEVAVGATFAWVLVLTNTGTDTATSVTLWDTLPPGTSFQSASSGGTFDGVKVDWTAGTLPPGGTLSVTVYSVYTATGGPVGPNIGWAGWANSEGWTATITGSNSVMVTGAEAKLLVGKWADRALAPVGGLVTWTVTLTNTGMDTAANITVWDTLPGGVLYAGCGGGTGCAWDGSKVTWQVPNLSPGGMAVLTVSGTATAALTCPNTAAADYTNSATVWQPTAVSPAVCVIPVQAVMTLTKTTPKAQYAAGEPIVYTLAYANTGTDTAVNVTIWDSWTPNSAEQSLTGPGALQAGGRWAKWSLPPVSPGTTGFVTVTLTWTEAGCPAGEQVDDIASLDYSNSANRPQGRESMGLDVDIANAGLTLTLTPSGWVISQGSPLSYLLTYTNPCTDTAWNISLWDTLPAGVVFLAASGGGTATGWTLPSVPPGLSGSVTLSVSVVGTGTVGPMVIHGSFTNGATVWQPPEISESIWVGSRAPALSVVKDSPAEAVTQETITFTLVVTNIGNDTAAGVTLVDSLPPPLRFVTASNGGKAEGRVVSWALGNLSPGGVATVTVTARGPDEEEDYALTNVGVATFHSPGGIGEPPASGSRSFLLHPRLVIRVYPNPYDPSVAVRGTLKFSGLPAGAIVHLYTLSGVAMRTLTAGANHRAEWDGRNEQGSPAAGGAYLYAIEYRDAAGKVTWIKGKIGVMR